MTTSESKGRFFLQNESIRITNRIESIRIANWNALTNRILQSTGSLQTHSDLNCSIYEQNCFVASTTELTLSNGNGRT